MQSKLHSAIEAFANVIIGFCIAIAAQVVIFPLFGGAFTIAQNLQIGALFTVVSLVRSYCLRRFFNWITMHFDKQERYKRKRAQYRSDASTVDVRT